jgi:hypothetical protein
MTSFYRSPRLVLGIAAAAIALAAPPASAQIQVQVNGREVQFGAVQPARIGGRVLIPLRAVVEALGAEIKWDAATQTVHGTKGEKEFDLPIGARTATVNGGSVSLDVPAQLISGTTMVPLRFVAEALGAEVEWNAAEQRVVVNAGEDAAAPAAGRITGELITVRAGDDPPTVTVRANGVRQTYEVGRDTIILRGEQGRRGSPVDLADLQPGDQVRLRLGPDGGVAEVVEATIPRGGGDNPPPAAGGAISGEVVAIRPNGAAPTITLRTATGRVTLDISDDASVSRGAATGQLSRARLEDVRVGDQVRLFKDQQGMAERIEARSAAASPPAGDTTVSGEVVAVRSQGGASSITLRTPTGRVRFEVPEDAVVLRGTGTGRLARADLEEIQIGDQVRLVRTGEGTASRIEARAAAAGQPGQGSVTGEVVAIRAGATPSLTVRSGADRATYEIAPDTILFRATGTAKAVRVTLNELQIGDQVKLRLDETGTTAEVVEAAAAIELPDPTPARDLRIQSFTHNGTGTLRSGAQLRLSLVGTPGATATFDVGSLAKNQPLKEDPAQPGHYSGTFVVPKGTTAKSVPVIAQLKVGTRSAPLIQAGALLNVDSEAPLISEATPGNNADTVNQSPDIYVELTDGAGSGLDRESLRVTVRGKDVTEDVKVTPRFLLYTPPAALTPGPVPVTVRARDKAGNETAASWTFTIKPGTDAIQSVTHNASKSLAAGDVITVTVRGQAKGRATFSIGDLAEGVPMRETAPGTYVGRYTVKQGDEASKAAVTVAFVTSDGDRVTQAATAPVNILTLEPKAPTITFPSRTFTLSEDLIVEGTAAPGSKVVVEVTYTGKAFGALPVKGTFGSQEVTVGRDGKWETEPFTVRLPLGVRRPTLVIEAISTDAAGTESEPVRATVETR